MRANGLYRIALVLPSNLQQVSTPESVTLETHSWRFCLVVIRRPGTFLGEEEGGRVMSLNLNEGRGRLRKIEAVA